jgi:hypothetical protein
MGWVAQSAEHYTYWVATSGEHLIYVSSEVYDWEPFDLHLFNIVTQEATVLTQDDYAFPGGNIHNNLVNWSTAKFNGNSSALPIDSMILDIRSGLSRRLTSGASLMGVGKMAFPYMIVGNWLAISQESNVDYYIANLVKLGVTDLDGNLIPGEPVLAPPPDGP